MLEFTPKIYTYMSKSNEPLKMILENMLNIDNAWYQKDLEESMNIQKDTENNTNSSDNTGSNTGSNNNIMNMF